MFITSAHFIKNNAFTLDKGFQKLVGPYKKIIGIVSIALALVALCYGVHRYLNSKPQKQNEEKKSASVEKTQGVMKVSLPSHQVKEKLKRDSQSVHLSDLDEKKEVNHELEDVTLEQPDLDLPALEPIPVKRTQSSISLQSSGNLKPEQIFAKICQKVDASQDLDFNYKIDDLSEEAYQQLTTLLRDKFGWITIQVIDSFSSSLKKDYVFAFSHPEKEKIKEAYKKKPLFQRTINDIIAKTEKAFKAEYRGYIYYLGGSGYDTTQELIKHLKAQRADWKIEARSNFNNQLEQVYRLVIMPREHSEE